MTTFGIPGGAAATWPLLATIRYSIRLCNTVKYNVAEKDIFSALPEINGRHILAVEYRAAGRGQ